MFKLHHLSITLLAAGSLHASFASETLPEPDAVATDEQALMLRLPSSLAPSSSTVAPPLTSAPTLAPPVSNPGERRARNYQKWLNRINKPYANQLGSGNGDGVTIGLVDSGVQTNHPMLIGQVHATYNAFTGGTDVQDQTGHGTHVAGILAGTTAHGAKAEGVAPGAKLAVAKVFATGSSSSTVIERGLNWAVNTQRAPIVSLSLGANVPALQASMQNAVARGTLVAAALGNDGKTTSASWPAAFAKEAWAKGHIIAVGALDGANERASFSNYDPALADFTVYAPGTGVMSGYSTPAKENAYAKMSGTSMATPIVAGQAALIKSNWNFLSAPTIAQVIFQSSKRLCSDSAAAATCASRSTADPKFGWGLVDVGASLQPIGGLTVGTASGAKVAFTPSTIATPKSGLIAGLQGLNTIAVDKFNRGFVVNLGSTGK